MDIVIHRVNTIAQLKTLRHEYGVEIDLRADGSEIILNHEPFRGGQRFIDYLDCYQHGLMILNIKEAGIEAEVLRLVHQSSISRYFLLDVEFPYIYQASREGIKAIAMRYSEDESIETVMKYSGMVDWVWVDTNTCLPLDQEVMKRLDGFKICLVCPERWGRPNGIKKYRSFMAREGIRIDAVMTSLDCVNAWL